MFSEKELNNKTLSELKNIAGQNNVKYSKSLKKTDLINLITKDFKLKEEHKKQKDKVSENVSSQQFVESQQNKVSFENIPDLPSVYGKNKLVFMVRDPYWGFLYWEMKDSLIKEHNFNSTERLLRVYDITESGDPDSPTSFFDVKINNFSNNWYIKFPQPNRTFVVDLGYFKTGIFVTVLRSNAASTPRDDVSDQIDEEWMLTDDQFKLILQASGADSMFQQIGSQELMKFLSANIEENLSSGGGSVTSPFGSHFDK